MKRGYFAVALSDIRSSKSWLRNVLLLALVVLVPLIGPVIVLGYIFGWSREVAWGILTPMPEHPFARTGDHKLRRGVDLVVLAIVFLLVPFITSHCAQVLFIDLIQEQWGSDWEEGLPFSVIGALHFALIAGTYILTMIVMLFILVGWMRVVIYGRLSAGFQIARSWSMIRYEVNGLLRIAGIVAVVLAAMLLIWLIFALAVGRVGIVAGILQVFTGYAVNRAIILRGLIPIAIVLLPAALYLSSVVGVFGQMIVGRAMGYWTAQFDVPHWQGQDDPMPFEVVQEKARASDRVREVTSAPPQSGKPR